MKVTINGKEYEPIFNIKFLRLLDKHMGITMDVQGAGKQPFGMAMTRVASALKTYDTAVLSDIIYYALWNASPRPSRDDIDAMIDDPKTDIEKLFEDVVAAMKKSNSVKLATKNL